MIVELDDSVFRLANATARRRFISLLQCAEDRDHHVHHAGGDPVPRGSLAEQAMGTSSSIALEDRSWIENCLRIGFQAAQRPNASRRLIRVHDGRTSWSGPIPVLSITDAQDYLAKPVEVLVENDQNDRRFLERWVPSARAKDFQTAIDKSMLGFSNSGGVTGIPSRLKGADNRNDRSFLHRALAIFDSDAAEPGAPSSNAKKCERSCKKHIQSSAGSQRFHQLKRRAIENYLPHDVLDDYVAGPGTHVHPSAVASLRALGPTSAHARHYHMKKGLISDLTNPQRKKAYQDNTKLPWDPMDVQHLPPHWQGPLPISLNTLLRGFSDSLAAWCTEKMAPPARYAFDDDAQREAEDVFAMMLSWV